MGEFLEDPAFKLFLCGIFGSIVVEALTILRYYQRPGRFPSRYRKKGFWIARSIIAFAGGVLAILYHPANLLLAVHIGASTPLIIATMAEAIPDDE